MTGPPGVQFGRIGVNRVPLLVGMTVDRQTFGLLPSPHGAHTVPEIGGYLFPGKQAIGLRGRDH
jgi:hypothetical protein